MLDMSGAARITASTTRKMVQWGTGDNGNKEEFNKFEEEVDDGRWCSWSHRLTGGNCCGGWGGGVMVHTGRVRTCVTPWGTSLMQTCKITTPGVTTAVLCWC